MDASERTGQRASLSDYLAAERTLLAWIRTGLALMGFGFVVARFGLFLQQLQLIQHASATQSYGLSLWFGTALIAAGVIMNVFAGWHHLRLVRQLDRGRTEHSRPSTQAVAIAFFLALIGLAMAAYLVSVRVSTSSQPRSNEEISMALSKVNGIIDTPSNHSVDQTVERLKGILQAKGVALFALVDHSGEAEKVGMKMPPTKLLIFGSPKRHNLPPELLQNIAVIENLAAKAAE
jgi:putative membrane protein